MAQSSPRRRLAVYRGLRPPALRLTLVRTAGRRFAFNGHEFCASGFNAYYLAYCSDAIQISVLRKARERDANVMRVWAFYDANSEHEDPRAFQVFRSAEVNPSACETGLRRLDSLIAHAEEAGIFLILPLINGWPEFGGMPLYAKASGCGTTAEDFFACERAMGHYRAWVERAITRRNKITGRFYAEEPAVLAWELANEPRHSGPDGGTQLLDWIAQSSEAIKQIDSGHLLAVGDEGFFSRRSRWVRARFTRAAHLYDGRYGVNAEAILRLPTIDFGTYHLYPEHWGLSARFGARWIREHTRLGAAMRKPVLLEEFGLSGRYSGRLEQYARWNALACRDGAGALLWMLGCPEVEAAGYRDVYTVV